jgi:streptomycin 6-kinase
MVDRTSLPPELVKNLRDIHDDAEAWLERLPEALRALEGAWQVRVTGVVPELSYNLVLYAERFDGTPCILKLSPPSDELAREGEALTFYAGNGICRLLARDDAVGALLLERLLPGVSLQETWTPEGDERHTRTAAELMVRLWRPVPEPHPFCPLERWARSLWRYQGEAIPESLRERAWGLLQGLDTADPVLLHADLHHGNVLTTPSGPLAIDPKGIVGARGYEVGSFLLNPVGMPSSVLVKLLPRRLTILSEVTGLTERELAAWGFVHAVLSACWSGEDHGGGYEGALELAHVLEHLT